MHTDDSIGIIDILPGVATSRGWEAILKQGGILNGGNQGLRSGIACHTIKRRRD